MFLPFAQCLHAKSLSTAADISSPTANSNTRGLNSSIRNVPYGRKSILYTKPIFTKSRQLCLITCIAAALIPSYILAMHPGKDPLIRTLFGLITPALTVLSLASGIRTSLFTTLFESVSVLIPIGLIETVVLLTKLFSLNASKLPVIDPLITAIKEYVIDTETNALYFFEFLLTVLNEQTNNRTEIFDAASPQISIALPFFRVGNSYKELMGLSKINETLEKLSSKFVHPKYAPLLEQMSQKIATMKDALVLEPVFKVTITNNQDILAALTKMKEILTEICNKSMAKESLEDSNEPEGPSLPSETSNSSLEEEEGHNDLGGGLIKVSEKIPKFTALTAITIINHLGEKVIAEEHAIVQDAFKGILSNLQHLLDAHGSAELSLINFKVNPYLGECLVESKKLIKLLSDNGITEETQDNDASLIRVVGIFQIHLKKLHQNTPDTRERLSKRQEDFKKYRVIVDSIAPLKKVLEYRDYLINFHRLLLEDGDYLNLDSGLSLLLDGFSLIAERILLNIERASKDTENHIDGDIAHLTDIIKRIVDLIYQKNVLQFLPEDELEMNKQNLQSLLNAKKEILVYSNFTWEDLKIVNKNPMESVFSKSVTLLKEKKIALKSAIKFHFVKDLSWESDLTILLETFRQIMEGLVAGLPEPAKCQSISRAKTIVLLITKKFDSLFLPLYDVEMDTNSLKNLNLILVQLTDVDIFKLALLPTDIQDNLPETDSKRKELRPNAAEGDSVFSTLILDLTDKKEILEKLINIQDILALTSGSELSLLLEGFKVFIGRIEAAPFKFKLQNIKVGRNLVNFVEQKYSGQFETLYDVDSDLASMNAISSILLELSTFEELTLALFGEQDGDKVGVFAKLIDSLGKKLVELKKYIGISHITSLQAQDDLDTLLAALSTLLHRVSKSREPFKSKNCLMATTLIEKIEVKYATEYIVTFDLTLDENSIVALKEPLRKLEDFHHTYKEVAGEWWSSSAFIIIRNSLKEKLDILSKANEIMHQMLKLRKDDDHEILRNALDTMIIRIGKSKGGALLTNVAVVERIVSLFQEKYKDYCIVEYEQSKDLISLEAIICEIHRLRLLLSDYNWESFGKPDQVPAYVFESLFKELDSKKTALEVETSGCDKYSVLGSQSRARDLLDAMTFFYERLQKSKDAAKIENENGVLTTYISLDNKFAIESELKRLCDNSIRQTGALMQLRERGLLRLNDEVHEASLKSRRALFKLKSDIDDTVQAIRDYPLLNEPIFYFSQVSLEGLLDTLQRKCNLLATNLTIIDQNILTATRDLLTIEN